MLNTFDIHTDLWDVLFSNISQRSLDCGANPEMLKPSLPEAVVYILYLLTLFVLICHLPAVTVAAAFDVF